MQSLLFIIQYFILFPFAILLAIIGIGLSIPSYVIYASVLLLIINIIYSIKDIKSRIVFFVLQFTTFLFLIGRPFINSIEGKVLFEGYSTHIQLVSAIGLLTCVGAMTFFTFINKIAFCFSNQIKQNNNFGGWNMEKVNAIRFLANIIAFITFFAALIVSIEKIGYRDMYSLSEYYANYNTSLPILIYKIGDLYLFSFLLYMATLPNKKESRIHVILFFVYSISTLFYGVRNILVLNMLVYVIYCVIRNRIDDNEKWITNKIVIVGIILFPIIAVALQGFDYIRRGTGLNINDFSQILSLDLFSDFFISQGISVLIIPMTIVYESSLGGQPVMYSLGSLYGYIRGNMVTRALFGFPAINQNTFDMAMYGGHLGSRLAYLEYPVTYLKGVGMGSSYVAELFVDFSYLGIFIGSVFIAWLSLNITNFIGKSPIIFSFGLIAIRWLIYIPRDTYFNWFIQAFSIMNVSFIIFIIIFSKLISNKSKRNLF